MVPSWNAFSVTTFMSVVGAAAVRGDRNVRSPADARLRGRTLRCGLSRAPPHRALPGWQPIDAEPAQTPVSCMHQRRLSEDFQTQCMAGLLSKQVLQDQVVSKLEYTLFLATYCAQNQTTLNNTCRLPSASTVPLLFDQLSEDLQSLFIQTVCPIGTPTTGACLAESKTASDEEFGISATPDRLFGLDDEIELLCASTWDTLAVGGVRIPFQTDHPTQTPTAAPAQPPTLQPSPSPTAFADSPTVVPVTATPTEAPTVSLSYTHIPTIEVRTDSPSIGPTVPVVTSNPTESTPGPSVRPTANVSTQPSFLPSSQPIDSPSPTQSLAFTSAPSSTSVTSMPPSTEPTKNVTTDDENGSNGDDESNDDDADGKLEVLEDIDEANGTLSSSAIVGIVLSIAGAAFFVAAIWSCREERPDLQAKKRNVGTVHHRKASRDKMPRKKPPSSSMPVEQHYVGLGAARSFDDEQDDRRYKSSKSRLHGMPPRRMQDDYSDEEGVVIGTTIAATQSVTAATQRSENPPSRAVSLPSFIDFNNATPGRRTEQRNPMNLLSPRESSWRPVSTKNKTWS